MTDPLEYLPTIAWRTYMREVLIVSEETLLTPAIYKARVVPIDLNDLGAPTATKAVGYYIADYIGNVYKITEINVGGDSEVIKVSDDFRVGQCPQSGQQAVLYQSADGGLSPYLAPIITKHLSELALENLRSRELTIMWRTEWDDIRNIPTAPAFEGTNFTNIPDGALIERYLNTDQTTPQSVINGAPTFEGIQFNLVDTITPVEGLMTWNADDGTIDVGLPGGVVGQMFHETYFDGKNRTGSIIPDGTPVMFAAPVGASGKVEIQPAIADGSIPSQYIMGLASEAIGIGEFGKVTWFGKVRGINTTGTPYGEVWSNGDLIYVGTTAGTLTNVEPNAPNQRILVATVIVAHSNGTLLLRPTWNPKLTDLDDINGTPLTTSGQLLIWDNDNNYFDFTENINDYIPRTQNVLTKDPTGFTAPESVIATYNSTTRTITLTGTVTAYWQGTLVTELVSGWVSDAHAATTGPWFLTYNGSAFSWSQTPWTFDLLMISYVYYGTSDKFNIRESHGLMPFSVHRELHQTIGTYMSAGGDLTGYVLSSTTAADRRPIVSTTTLYDEDLMTSVATLTSSLYTKAYLSGASATPTFVVETADIVPLSGNQPYYNQFTGGTWQQTLMSNGYYQAIWLVAVPAGAGTTSQKYRYLWVQGQRESNSLTTIQALSPKDVNFGAFSAIATEFAFIDRIIIRYIGGNWQLIQVDKLTGSRVQQATTTVGNYLSIVNVDTTLTGDGTSTNLLGVATQLAAINALTPTDSNFIVGNGTTWVAESGATVRTSLGLGNVENVAASTLYELIGVAAGLVTTHETTYNHANYDTAYGWGDHAGLYELAGSIATHASDANAHHTRYVLTEDLAADEISQLQNIDTTTITVAQWGYLGAMSAQPLESETSHADVLVDSDFGSTPGFMKVTGAGTYIVDTNTYLTSETSHADVVVDGDFTTNGILVRTALGVYGVITDNSSNWNTAYSHSQLTSGNPHSVTASDVGLGNVENAAASGLYAPISGSANYIQNRNTSAQTANMWISGSATITGDYSSFFIGNSSGVKGSLNTAVADDSYMAGSTNGDIILRAESSANKVMINSGGGNVGLVVKNGDVGIGLTPNNRFQVSDLINFDNTKYSTILGYRALYNNTGNYNTAIGYNAGYNNDSIDNVYIGYNAGYGNTTNSGFQNIGIGNSALLNNTTGHHIFAGGHYALANNGSGYDNVAIGTAASWQSTSASGITAIGNESQYLNQTGWYNVSVGDATLHQTTGSNNLSLGSYSGYWNTTGSYNIFLGDHAGSQNTTLSNRLVIDSRERANISDEINKSIIYGIMDDTETNQYLNINANLSSFNIEPENLGTGYVPYKSSSFLVNSNLYTNGTNFVIGGTNVGSYALKVVGGGMSFWYSDGASSGAAYSFQPSSSDHAMNIINDFTGHSVLQLKDDESASFYSTVTHSAATLPTQSALLSQVTALTTIADLSTAIAGLNNTELITPLRLNQVLEVTRPIDYINEEVVGIINGTNDTFTTNYTFRAATTRVYLNGQRQKLGLQYNESGDNTIIFTASYIPQTDDIIIIDFKS